MQNMQNMSWANGVYNKKLVLSETKLHVITIVIVYKCSIISDIYQLYVAIDYCVLFFIECKLTIISFTENNCKCLFFSKESIVI